ncbi:hypothetical protein ACFSUD_00495 [Sulfitobacter aestuarii]|uniref:Uncharacterized protein n=1 Tax=Sulfitobacter aestuarii TaxID=2161676 RepID=A0ABW5TYK8_9RHOB
MYKVAINGAEVHYLELFRIAVSESDHEKRMRSIHNVRHEVKMEWLKLQISDKETTGMSGSSNVELLRDMAELAMDAPEMIREFTQTVGRYEGANGRGNERKLNVAEHIGKQVLLSIREGTFHGVQSDFGILEQVRHDAKDLGITGARDVDTLREIWKTYRGVVHLGIAMDEFKNAPDWGPDVLINAEMIRRTLSQNCPRSHKSPYVDPKCQIYFPYNPIV